MKSLLFVIVAAVITFFFTIGLFWTVDYLTYESPYERKHTSVYL